MTEQEERLSTGGEDSSVIDTNEDGVTIIDQTEVSSGKEDGKVKVTDSLSEREAVAVVMDGQESGNDGLVADIEDQEAAQGEQEEETGEDGDDDDDDDDDDDNEYEESTVERKPEDLPHVKLGALEKLKRRMHTEVTNIRLDSEGLEHERRIRTEQYREAMQQKLIDNSVVSAKRNASISMQWPRVARMRDPVEMHQNLQDMEMQSERVIQGKDMLIQELVNALRDKDGEYVNALRSQDEDMMNSIHHMHDAISMIMYENEETLQNVETEFIEDRAQLLEQNNRELAKILEKRREVERTSVYERRNRVEKQDGELQENIEGEMEKHAAKKKELDDALHILEQGIDDMRGFYQLSIEQLNHFHSTALARVNENETAWRNNKTKLARLQDQLSGIKAKYARDDKKYRHINNDLTEQFGKLAKQYKDLLIKFKFFEENDTKQYNDVWKMKQELVQELAEKLMDADKVITEELLGLEWIPPAEDPFRMPGKVASYTSGFISERSGNISDTGSKTVSASAYSTQSATESQPIEVAKKIVEMIGDSAGFFVENKVQRAIDGLSHEEGNILKVDAILRAMGVENPDEIDKMMSYFVKESGHIDELEQFQGGKDPNGSVIVMIHGTKQAVRLISQQSVVKVLRRFVEEQQRSTMNQNIKKRNRILNAEERRKDRKLREEREYWQRIANVIPDSTYRIWSALEQGTERYGELLTERANLLDECEVIRMQNNELRSLLISYSNSKINEELHAPPSV